VRWLLLAAVLAGGCQSASGDPPGATRCTTTLAIDADGCRLVQAMRLPATLPPARGNRFGDRVDAASLGFALFFRSDLGHGTSCATCHQPEVAFTSRAPVAVGHGPGTRNAPTVFNAARSSVQFWDGRADSLWSQPLFAFENPLEMASSRVELVQAVAADAKLAPAYEAIFGPLPDRTGLPATGKPGEPAWEALPPAQQTAVNRVVANLGKALEAYLRKNSTGPAPLDRWLDGDDAAISDLAKRGVATFVTKGCVGCHTGPSFSDEKFHRTSFASAGDDPGRAGAIEVLKTSPFTLAGPFSDEPYAVDTSDQTTAAFRTAPLRNVARTAPYGHAGTKATLSDALAEHASALTADERGAILAMLLSLNGDYPLPPWSDWPQRQ
jgi:cytochrome c peroxidase